LKIYVQSTNDLITSLHLKKKPITTQTYTYKTKIVSEQL